MQQDHILKFKRNIADEAEVSIKKAEDVASKLTENRSIDNEKEDKEEDKAGQPTTQLMHTNNLNITRNSRNNFNCRYGC